MENVNNKLGGRGRPYPPEFKKMVLEYVKITSVGKASRRYNVAPFAIKKWIEQELDVNRGNLVSTTASAKDSRYGATITNPKIPKSPSNTVARSNLASNLANLVKTIGPLKNNARTETEVLGNRYQNHQDLNAKRGRKKTKGGKIHTALKPYDNTHITKGVKDDSYDVQNGFMEAQWAATVQATTMEAQLKLGIQFKAGQLHPSTSKHPTCTSLPSMPSLLNDNDITQPDPRDTKERIRFRELSCMDTASLEEDFASAKYRVRMPILEYLHNHRKLKTQQVEIERLAKVANLECDVEAELYRLRIVEYPESSREVPYITVLYHMLPNLEHLNRKYPESYK